MCKFVAYAVPMDPYAVNSPAVSKIKCEEHQWTDFSVIVDNMCPLGRIEKAVAEGLAHLKAHSNISDKHSTAIAEIIKKMINERQFSNQAKDNLNYLTAYFPIARAVIKYMNENVK